MTEQQDNEAMQLIEAMEGTLREPQEWVLDSIESKAMLDHLYQLHKLRDKSMMDGPNSLWTAILDLDKEGDEDPSELYNRVYDMQT